MNNYHDIHLWSKQYREERLRDARMRHLEGHLREDRRARRSRGPVSLALANVLSLVRGS